MGAVNAQLGACGWLGTPTLIVHFRRANLGPGRPVGGLGIPMGRSSGLSSVTARCNPLEASHIDCDALVVLDVEAVFLAAEPRGGGDRSVGLPVEDFDADSDAAAAAGSHLVESGLVHVRRFHPPSVRRSRRARLEREWPAAIAGVRVATRSVPESVHMWGPYFHKMSSGSDQPYDRTLDERRAARDKRWAEARAEDWRAERSIPPTPLQPRAKERLRSLKPTDIPSLAPGDDPYTPPDSL